MTEKRCVRCSLYEDSKDSGFDSEGSLVCQDYTEHPHDGGGSCGPAHVFVNVETYDAQRPLLLRAVWEHDRKHRVHHDRDHTFCTVCTDDPPEWIRVLMNA